MRAAFPAIALAAMAGAWLAGCDRAVSPAGATYPDSSSRPNVPATASLQRPAREASGPVRESVTTAKIKAAIASDAGMKGADISVTTDDGVVTLSGSARNPEQVTIATQLAQRHEGVTRIENRVEVR